MLQSGTEYSPWALHVPDAKPEDFIEDVASQFGCPIDDTEMMVDCLRTIDALSLYEARYNCTVSPKHC